MEAGNQPLNVWEKIGNIFQQYWPFTLYILIPTSADFLIKNYGIFGLAFCWTIILSAPIIFQVYRRYRTLKNDNNALKASLEGMHKKRSVWGNEDLKIDIPFRENEQFGKADKFYPKGAFLEVAAETNNNSIFSIMILDSYNKKIFDEVSKGNLWAENKNRIRRLAGQDRVVFSYYECFEIPKSGEWYFIIEILQIQGEYKWENMELKIKRLNSKY